MHVCVADVLFLKQVEEKLHEIRMDEQTYVHSTHAVMRMCVWYIVHTQWNTFITVLGGGGTFEEYEIWQNSSQLVLVESVFDDLNYQCHT